MKRKSTLLSFRYAKDCVGIAPEILELFAGYENATIYGEPVFDYIIDVMDAYENGKINLKYFNLFSYIKGIQQNKTCNKEKQKSKMVFFKPDTDEDSDDRDSISASHLISQEDAYAEYDDRDELQWAVKEINRLYDEMLCDYGVNIIHVMKKAASGFPQALEVLKNLCAEAEIISELLYIILSSGQSLDELFPENEKEKIVKAVNSIVEEHEMASDKVVSIRSGYDAKDGNVLQLRKIGLKAYKVKEGMYVAYSMKEEDVKKVNVVNK